MRPMKTIKGTSWRITAVLLIVPLILLLTACTSGKSTKLESGDITAENLPIVCEVLKACGLFNVDVFENWVQGYLNGGIENGDVSGFSDADCRMTVMLLAGDSITSDSVEENYAGTYLMFDVEAIDNQEGFSVLKDKERLFTTLFGEMPIPDGNFHDAFPNNLKKYGIQFGGKDFSVISILFKAYEEENAFVGHTGLLIDCGKIASVDAEHLFVEKIAFNDVYKVTKVKDEKELLKVLSERADYMVEEGDPYPLAYKNDELIGEIKG